MVAFQTLGELSDHLAAQSAAVNLEVVDPGVPLLEAAGDPWDVWRTQPSVRKVVDFIARALASTPLHAFERVSDTDRRRVTTGPLADVLGAPRPRLTPFRFWHSIVVDWLVHDRWCAMKVPDADTGGLQLVRIPPRRFRLVANYLDEVSAVKLFYPNGETAKENPEAFIFDRGYSPTGANGTTPMETLKDILAEYREAVEYRRTVWKNGARVPAVIERPKDETGKGWDPKARERFVNSWRNFMRGGGREGGTPILEDGMTLSKVDVFSPSDTKDIEGRQLTDAEVAAAFHVAPELVGAREGNYSNLDAFRQMLYRDSLGPYFIPIEQVINAMLVPDLAGPAPLYVEWHLDAKLRGSFEDQAKVLQSSTGAPWLTRNEARARQNLPAIDGGDDLVTPLNVITGGLASPRDTAPKARLRKAARSKARPDDLGPLVRERDALAADLERFWAKQTEALAARLQAKALPSLYDEFDVEQWNAELTPLLAGRSLRVAEASAWEVLEEYNPEADGWSADVMEPWLVKAASSNAARWNNQLYTQLAAALGGEDWQDTVAAVLAAAGFAAIWATTFGTEAASFGAQDAATASGLGTKTWMVHSKNPRPSHAALSGQTVAIDDIFGNGCRWPGDTGGGADEVAGCSCSVTYSRGDD